MQTSSVGAPFFFFFLQKVHVRPHDDNAPLCYLPLQVLLRLSTRGMLEKEFSSRLYTPKDKEKSGISWKRSKYDESNNSQGDLEYMRLRYKVISIGIYSVRVQLFT